MSKANIIKKTAIMICSIGFFVLLVYLIVDISDYLKTKAEVLREREYPYWWLFSFR